MRLFIGNLSYDLTEQELRDVLAEHEPIVDMQRPMNRETGKPRGFAFVTVPTRDAGEKVIDDFKRVDDRPIGPDGRRIRHKGV